MFVLPSSLPRHHEGFSAVLLSRCLSIILILMESIQQSASQRRDHATSLILKAIQSALTLDDKQLNTALRGSGINDQEKVTALNDLISANRVLVSVNEKGLPLYRFQNEESAKRMGRMDPEDFAVYEKIEEARDRGITANDLKNKLQALGFNQTVLNKVLKRLEKDGTIKKLKSMQQKHKQVYMLMEVEPSSEVTGGLVNHEAFNLDVIEVVQDRVCEYFKTHGDTSYREIALYIRQMGGLMQNSADFKEEHIRQIVQVLVFDQRIEAVGVDVFRYCQIKYPYSVTYSGVACSVCPIRAQCGPSNLVNPKSCEYLQQQQ